MSIVFVFMGFESAIELNNNGKMNVLMMFMILTAGHTLYLSLRLNAKYFIPKPNQNG